MNIIVLDFETWFSDDYTLSKMTTESYVRDPRFEAHGLGVRFHNGDLAWFDDPDEFLHNMREDPNVAVLCHHAAFDGLILSHHYGIRPARFLCTMSMAAYLFPGQPRSLEALSARFGLAPKSVPYDLMKGRRWASLSNVERDLVAQGCLRDCENTYEIFNRMMKGDY